MVITIHFEKYVQDARPVPKNIGLIVNLNPQKNFVRNISSRNRKLSKLQNIRRLILFDSAYLRLLENEKNTLNK